MLGWIIAGEWKPAAEKEGELIMAKDIALFNILTNNLLAVAREMSADMLRSAYSTVIREAADAGR